LIAQNTPLSIFTPQSIFSLGIKTLGPSSAAIFSPLLSLPYIDKQLQLELNAAAAVQQPMSGPDTVTGGALRAGAFPATVHAAL
jgi:hypothetical protein